MAPPKKRKPNLETRKAKEQRKPSAAKVADRPFDGISRITDCRARITEQSKPPNAAKIADNLIALSLESAASFQLHPSTKFLCEEFVKVQKRREADALNPKDLIGSTKLPVGLVPDVLVTEVSLAFLEGALKYGRYNWRAAGVRSSIYHDALRRHVMKWWNGEDRDAKTRVKHLANAGACIAILLDAELQGKLTDDRPVAQPGLSNRIDEQVTIIKHLRELFKDHNPKQYTIADSP